MGLRDLKKELNKLDKETLIKHITELYTKFGNVKEYYDLYTNQNEEKLLNKYKERVKKAFFIRRFECDLSMAKKAIADFKKLGVSPEIYANLLLYHVECCVEYINEFGENNFSFFTSITNYFYECLGIYYEEKVLQKYEESVRTLIKTYPRLNSNLGMSLDEIFYEYYDYLDEEVE
ncbi:MAG: DUF6155 family protein [bacterium]